VSGPATTTVAPADLGADQAMLRETVDKLLGDPPASPQQGAARPDTWARLAELGLLDIAVSAEAGGPGGSGLDLFVVAEAVGAHLTTEPWLPTALGAMAVAAGGSQPLRAEVLPAVAAGRCRLAVTPDTLTGPHPTLHATATGDSMVLDGAAHGVAGGPTADRFLVIAHARDTAGSVPQPVVALVDREAPGLSEATYRTVDDRRASDLAFSAVPAERVLEPDRGGPLAGMLLDAVAACLAAEAAGAMAAAVELTVEHLRVRHQFGAPLASFQALRHRVVDMYVAAQQVRSMALVACASLDGCDGDRRRRGAAAAKALAGRHGRFVGEQAVQLHGGMGMSAEHAASHYLKRLLAIEAQGGTSGWQLRRLAGMAGP
jgi:alkylation response protein AidB-like acyl-CoA dehydrogenase